LVKEGKVVPVFNYLSTMPWRYMGKLRYGSNIFYFSIKWRWVAQLHAPAFLPSGKSPHVHIG
jgi:hypothetical protein